MKIALLATDGFEQSELLEPRSYFKDKGHDVHVVSLRLADAEKAPTEIKGWDQKDWGKSVAVDRQLGEVSVDDYDALILPGGQMNPDLLRAESTVVDFIRAFAKTGKPLAAICHAPWLLVEAGLADGQAMTSYKTIRTDLRNAGAEVVDREVVVSGNLVTSRQPGDIPAFNRAIERLLASVPA